LGTAAAAWEPFGVKERYMIHCAPLAFLALVLWVERGAARRRAVWAAAGAAVALVCALPLATLFGEPALLGNAFALVPFFRLADAAGSVALARALVSVGAVAAAAFFLWGPP